ncbi:MAG: AAA family ATPase [Chlamydiota bacterium]
MKKLPIGIQSIRELLEEKQAYVDKTEYVLSLIRSGKHYFISRPRRFGKSLFVNTLEEVFRGNKELFQGLAIYDSDYDWQRHPVLHFDFSLMAATENGEFKASLREALIKRAKSDGLPLEGGSIQSLLSSLLEKLSEKNRVVVLVDEYDHAIINHLKRPETAEKNRDTLKDFFATLKALDKYLKFTFVTGVSKFTQVSLFSGPNHLKDITMDPKYAAMMGYTEGEIKTVFSDHIQAVAETKSKQLNRSIDEKFILKEIATWYNGYRFSREKACVHNPFSTINYLDGQEATAYWYATATPSFLIDELKKHPESMVSLDGTTTTQEKLMDIGSFERIDIEALMYQTGYFTIRGYNPISKRYSVGLPNEEVRRAFIHSLIQNLASITNLRSSEKSVKALEEHRPEPLFDEIKRGFSGFAYHVFSGAEERTYQGMLLGMLYGMGFEPLSEVATNRGRIDVVLELPKTTYILELKLDGSVGEALEQIHKKDYYRSYTGKGKEIVVIGANFSSNERNVADWRGEVLTDEGEICGYLHPKTSR